MFGLFDSPKARPGESADFWLIDSVDRKSAPPTALQGRIQGIDGFLHRGICRQEIWYLRKLITHSALDWLISSACFIVAVHSGLLRTRPFLRLVANHRHSEFQGQELR